MTIAVDFDGVIHDYKHPIEGRRMGGPIDGAKAALDGLSNQGHTILIHSVKANTPSGVDMIAKWLDYYDIRGLVWNMPGKPNANVYLDDRGLRFINWNQALKELFYYEGTGANTK